jgi:hypothetical protein
MAMRPMVTFWFDPDDGAVQLRQFCVTFRAADHSIQVEAFFNLRAMLNALHEEARVTAGLQPPSPFTPKGVH